MRQDLPRAIDDLASVISKDFQVGALPTFSEPNDPPNTFQRFRREPDDNNRLAKSVKKEYTNINRGNINSCPRNVLDGTIEHGIKGNRLTPDTVAMCKQEPPWSTT